MASAADSAVRAAEIAGDGTVSWGGLDGDGASAAEEEAWEVSIILTEGWELDEGGDDGRGAMTN